MASQIPEDIISIVARCSSDPHSVTWDEVELVAGFFEREGYLDLANKMRQTKNDVAAKKYDVVVDEEDVHELKLILGRRVFPFAYRLGEDLDPLVAKLIKKHNIAEGYPVGSPKYKKTFKNLKKVIHETTSSLVDGESTPRPIYSESHLDRPKTPSPAKNGTTENGSHPPTPPETDGTSAREVQESLASMKRAKLAASRRSASASSSTSSLTPKKAAPIDRPQSPPKEKFALKPPKRLPKRSSPQKRSFGTVASLSQSDEKMDPRGVLHGPGPNIAPSFNRSSMSGSRKRQREEVEVRARDIVRMVTDQGEQGAMTRLRQLGISSRELAVIRDRLDGWKTCVAEELLASRTKRRDRQVGQAVQHYMIDSEDEDEDDFVDTTRDAVDEELDSYFQLRTIVWARMPNQRYFRRGRVMDNLVGNNKVRVDFFDGKSPDKYKFRVEYNSSSIRRTKPPADYIDIDSDDFVFTYTKDRGVSSSQPQTTSVMSDVEALMKVAKLYAADLDRHRSRNRDDSYDAGDERRGARRSYGSTGPQYFPSTAPPSAFSFDFDDGDNDADGLGDELMTDAKSPIEFRLDETAEKITVKIRLKSNNEVIKAEFNTFHTVGDIRNFLDINHPVSGSYKLILGYPRRELDDDSQNVMDAQLKSSQILQR